MPPVDPKSLLEIDLERGDSGLGFNIKGGVDSPYIPDDPGVFIAKIRETGAAAQNGKLHEGDKIVEVNGQNVENMKHQDVVNLFLASGSNVKLKVWPNAEKIIADTRISSSSSQAKTSCLVSALKFIVGVSLLAGVSYAGYKYVRNKQSV
ncbi:hypothetical protein CAPTEDRAFT_173066 [Capitella teleta]|uniref:PDZ domain-containing protein n=1 Tax=Capitella teleta TaxID=283909 RepID=R7U8A4_CAPTE|nr:hypothetical protein CAPTEDRAFT_173066 [Capitella teleta]|eukprot:ELT99315.1 hypothetical protein CAPTEDRAFT_173066 [Capitella teleta]